MRVSVVRDGAGVSGRELGWLGRELGYEVESWGGIWGVRMSFGDWGMWRELGC